MAIVWLLCFLICPVTVLGACDLRVKIFDYDGKPINEVVRIASDKGAQLAEAQAVGGVAEFCDVGLGLFSVTVGLNVCGQVQVHMLEATPGRTLTVPVYHHNCHSFRVFDSCRVLVRLVDEAGIGLPEATVSAGKSTLKADKFGRVLLSAVPTAYRAVVKLSGYKEQDFEVACGPDTRNVEKTVVMRKQ